MNDARALRAEREGMLLRLLLRASRSMNDELTARLRARGHPEFQAAHTRVLAFIDTEGTRVGALARWMGTTRQAASQLLSAVEARGYVERQMDPDDKRGVIAVHTKRGKALLDDAIGTMKEIEDEYAAVVGAKELRALKQTLTRLLEHSDQRGTLNEHLRGAPRSSQRPKTRPRSS